jgi:hypothetical protein
MLKFDQLSIYAPVLKVLAAVLSCFACLLYGYNHGKKSVQIEFDRYKLEQQKRIIQKNEVLAQLSSEVDEKSIEKQEEIRTVFKDRFVYLREKSKNDPRETKSNTYYVPVSFVELWNSANRMQSPASAGIANEQESNITLGDIAAQKDRESEIAHINEQKLTDLQEWVRSVKNANQ